MSEIHQSAQEREIHQSVPVREIFKTHSRVLSYPRPSSRIGPKEEVEDEEMVLYQANPSVPAPDHSPVSVIPARDHSPVSDSTMKVVYQSCLFRCDHSGCS